MENVKSTPFAIEKLHQQDIAATRSLDVRQLLALWTDDGVLIGQGDKALVGKAAIEASFTRNFAANPEMKVLQYVPEVNDLQVVRDVAYEWGHFSVIQQLSATSQPMSFRARFLRVMKPQPAGSWRLARVMWNVEGPDSDPQK